MARRISGKLGSPFIPNHSTAPIYNVFYDLHPECIRTPSLYNCPATYGWWNWDDDSCGVTITIDYLYDHGGGTPPDCRVWKDGDQYGDYFLVCDNISAEGTPGPGTGRAAGHSAEKINAVFRDGHVQSFLGYYSHIPGGWW